MRFWPLAVLALAAACGKTLSAEYCAANPMDSDCRAGGLVVIDAPPTCTLDEQCMDPGMNVCDLMKGACVECSPDHAPTCPASAMHCGADDRCHQCLTPGPNSAECGGGYCLPDGMCSDDIAYANPTGPGPSCGVNDKCTLTNALETAHSVILLDPGTYAEGPITITRTVTIVGSDAKTTIIQPKPGDNNTVVTIVGGVVTIDSVTVANATTGSDGIACTGAGTTLSFHDGVVGPNSGTGIRTTGCTLAVDRSSIFNNDEAALIVTDSAIAITNNFVYGNGTAGDMSDAAVRLVGATSGALRFNSIAYNLRKKNTTAGLHCSTTGLTVVDDNIIAGNNPGSQVSFTGNCTVTKINFIPDAVPPMTFVAVPMPAKRTPMADLHLKGTAAAGVIIDNPQAICIDVTNDIDGDTRPQGAYCDLGGDEYK